IPPLGAVWLRFEPVPTEEQLEPDRVAAGVRAAARAVSPHAGLADEEDEAKAEVEVPPEDPVQPPRTEKLGSPVTTVPVSDDEGLIGGPPDQVRPPAVSDPMASAEAAAPVPSSSPASPDSPESPDSPASPPSPESPDSPPTTVR
ncbi:MAG TPA: hypothetical protein VGW74_00915, partial [Propionibacteriaceae bacterium]|nr:hypothetical protein [Propionibacteriaceae bacterium]